MLIASTSASSASRAWLMPSFRDEIAERLALRQRELQRLCPFLEAPGVQPPEVLEQKAEIAQSFHSRGLGEPSEYIITFDTISSVME